MKELGNAYRQGTPGNDRSCLMGKRASVHEKDMIDILPMPFPSVRGLLIPSVTLEEDYPQRDL